jgi:hypothetical protein
MIVTSWLRHHDEANESDAGSLSPAEPRCSVQLRLLFHQPRASPNWRRQFQMSYVPFVVRALDLASIRTATITVTTEISMYMPTPMASPRTS